MIHMNKPVTIIFCDLVASSLAKDEQQAQLLASLNMDVMEVLLPSESFLEPDPRILRLPTGDGMAIVLTEDQVERDDEVFRIIQRLKDWCQKEQEKARRQQAIAREEQSQATEQGAKAKEEEAKANETKAKYKEQQAKLRIAVHSGKAQFIRDINYHTTICGDTINDCQRILAAAHPDHVLISDFVHQRYFRGERNTTAGYSTSGPYPIVAKHDLAIQVHVLHKDEPGWIKTAPYPQYIETVEARAKFLLERLLELEQSKDDVRIYEQSALSTFSLIKQSYERTHPEYRYRELLAQQRKILESLAIRKNVQLRVIINPRLTYQDSLVRGRVHGLIKWMEKHVDHDNILWTEAETFGANQLILNDVLIDGFSGTPFAGLTLSRVTYDRTKINMAIKAFNERFADATFKDKREVIEHVKKQLKNFVSNRMNHGTSKR
jgi:class 3 adenylate cyclase